MTSKTITFPNGPTVPAIGLGTWMMGADRRKRSDEAAALKAGLDLGLTLVDTAEMYADGGAEEVVAEAIAGRRDELVLVSKVLPSNAARAATIRACEASLKRMKVERIDVYLLHWRGRVPLAETLEAFERLERDGKIGAWGVSNLDTDDLDELVGLPGGDRLATDQVLYNPGRRGVEHDLLPWCRSRGVPVMAYSPIEQGALAGDPTLARIGAKHGATPAQVALAWAIRDPGVIAIPKSSNPDRVRENAAALDLVLDAADLAAIDAAFPPPSRKVSLEML